MRTRSFPWKLLVLAGWLGLSIALAATPASPQAADYPTRPITFVVGFAPGGGADVFARALADALKGILPQAVAVENRPGAGGTAANAYVTGRPADGYTLLFAHAGSSIITPLLTNQPQLKWDAFDPIARIHGEEEWFFVRPDAQWKTPEEMIAFAKANPRRVRVSGSAIGGIDSFTALTWGKAAGVDFQYIPHEGGGPATLTFLGGNAELLIGNVSEVFQHIEAKRMVPFAVASERRSTIFPNVPTLKEKGWDVVYAQWRSVLAPAGTPPSRVATLTVALQKALATDSWKRFNGNAKAVDLYLGPADFRRFLVGEEARLNRIIDDLGLRRR
ncbi:MAG: Bug family tripartite tricarboxylate transporter substrate binding protein [bacterium]